MMLSKLNDGIRNTTAVCSPRQNSVREKIQEKDFFVRKKFCQRKKNCDKKFVSDIVLHLQCTF